MARVLSEPDSGGEAARERILRLGFWLSRAPHQRTHGFSTLGRCRAQFQTPRGD